MSEKKLISLVQKYNYLMGQAIQGPNCVDPTICLGDCCSIRIDVPKKLAEEYIKRKYAKETDFIRSNIFTFQLRFNESTTKCFLFDKSINGCSVHDSGIKPPQCWIYPTGFSSEDKIPIKCKKASGWFIMDKEKAQKAKKLLDEYINLCKIEAEEEKEKIVERIQQNSLLNLIKTIAPSHLGGFMDTWREIKPLSAEGLSLQMKKVCMVQNPSCDYLINNFLECKHICEEVAYFLLDSIKKKLLDFVKTQGLDVEGHYPLYKLLESWNR